MMELYNGARSGVSNEASEHKTYTKETGAKPSAIQGLILDHSEDTHICACANTRRHQRQEGGNRRRLFEGYLHGRHCGTYRQKILATSRTMKHLGKADAPW